MARKSVDPFALVKASPNFIVHWLQELDESSAVPFTRCELVTDSVRVVARPTDSPFSGQFAIEPLVPRGGLVDIGRVWPVNKPVMGTMRIKPYGARFLHFVAAAERAIRKLFAVQVYCTFTAGDEGGVKVELWRGEGDLRATFRCTDGFDVTGEAIAFNATLLADLVPLDGGAEVQHHGDNIPAIITPHDQQWRALHMPVKRLS